MSFTTRSPWTGKALLTYKYASSQQTRETALSLSQNFVHWRSLPLSERCTRIFSLSSLLRTENEKLAHLISTEMGKPVAQAHAEVMKTVDLVDWYAENSERILTHASQVSENPRNFQCHYRHDPLGVLLGLMPWNFPLWQVFRWAVPALIAGNVCLLKPAEQTAGTADAISDLFAKIFDRKIFETVHMTPERVHELIGDESVRGVSFTGSTRVGKLVAASAGAALKKCVTELGGSDAFVVLGDSPSLSDSRIDEIAELAVKARMLNSGQSCISPKRIIVHARYFDRFTQSASAALNRLCFGADYGPVVDLKAKASVEDQLRRGGAKIIARLPEMPEIACHVPPCIAVVSDYAPAGPLVNEEVFGPVAVLIKARDDAEALSMANDSAFGLGCSVFAGAGASVEEFVSGIDTGMCFVNSTVRSDARLPFGGTKSSGIGRECGATGLQEFVNVKLVCVRSSSVT